MALDQLRYIITAPAVLTRGSRDEDLGKEVQAWLREEWGTLGEFSTESTDDSLIAD